MPPYHPQDIHPYQPSGRHLCRPTPLHHIEHLPGMALHPTDEEDSKPEVLKQEVDFLQKGGFSAIFCYSIK